MKENNGSVSAVRCEFEGRSDRADGENASRFSYPVDARAVSAALIGKIGAVASALREHRSASAAAVQQPPPPPPVAQLRDSFPRLPDLVCDIAPRTETEGTAGTESGDEWSADADAEEDLSAVSEEEHSSARASPQKRRRSSDAAVQSWIVDTRAGETLLPRSVRLQLKTQKFRIEKV